MQLVFESSCLIFFGLDQPAEALGQTRQIICFAVKILIFYTEILSEKSNKSSQNLSIERIFSKEMEKYMNLIWKNNSLGTYIFFMGLRA